MPKEETRIILTRGDLLELICKTYNLDPKSSSIGVEHHNGDTREAGYTNVWVTGPKTETENSENK